MPTSAVRRRAARVLLKAASVPERLVEDGGGSVRLEMLANGDWRPVDLEWPEPTALAVESVTESPPGAR